MQGLHDLPTLDERQLSADVAVVIAQLRQRIEQQARQIDARQAELQAKAREVEHKAQEIERKDREIAWRDARLEKIHLELARLKRWKFGAKSEAMTAEQRALFEETVFEDEASLQAQLAALQALLPESPEKPKCAPRRPRRQALPEHLERVEHRHEPADTTCPNADCGQPMQRVGEDISEKLDLVPARFFGLAGRVDPEDQPFVRHELSSGQFMSALSTVTSTASGPAGAARCCARSRSNPTWSRAASRPVGWWRTP